MMTSSGGRDDFSKQQQIAWHLEKGMAGLQLSGGFLDMQECLTTDSVMVYDKINCMQW